MTLRILHLSDFHFKSTKNDPAASFNSDMVTTSMITAIKELVDSGITFELVIATGDFAFSGKQEEYAVAEEFFHQLHTVTTLSNNRFFIVPGNHDVDRNRVKPRHTTTWYPFDTQDTITEILTDDELFPILMKKFTGYNEFANIILGRRIFTSSKYSYVKKITICKEEKSFTLNLLGLNSALFAGYNGDDKQKLALGIHQVDNTTRQCDPNALFTFAFFHHPVTCLHPAEKVTINILKQKADVILHGHLHEPGNSVIHDGAGKAVIIGAGACFEERESKNSFNIIEIDPETGRGKVIFYKYLHQHHTWKKNYDVNPHNKDGEFEFVIEVTEPEKKIKTTPGGPMVSDEEDTRRYLEWVRDTCGSIEIRGLAVGSGKAHKFPINELYIPLYTHSSSADARTGKKDKGIDMAKSTAVPLISVLKNKYAVITGDPGSGKTTFLRYAASRLAGILLENGCGIREELSGLKEHFFPLFIRVSELTQFMIHCRDEHKDCPASDTDPRWIIRFLDDRNEALHWGFSAGFFSTKLHKGPVILFLDGLDEAPDRKMREAISTMVSDFTQVHTACRLVVTSRPQAYQDDIILTDFTPYSIAPLNEQGVQTFLRHWAKAFFSGHLTHLPEQAHYKELAGALKSSPAIRRMALNPMMLTALAVIHWNEKRLPEQRAELYESIITWLLRSREHKHGRLSAEKVKPYLCRLAFAMQSDPAGRRVQVGKKRAWEILAEMFDAPSREEKLARAEEFLSREEIDSGVVVERGGLITFWHLTFQEYLAAKALGGKSDDEQRDILLQDKVLNNPEWKEVLLLFCGVLHDQGPEKIDGFFTSFLEYIRDRDSLADKARFFGLLGAMERDLSPYGYKIINPVFTRLQEEVMALFDKETAGSIPVDIRCEAADALGQAGDPRLRGNTMVSIPGSTFLMGAQAKDPGGPNFDRDAYIHESPVHKVTLSPYSIGKYPVTVGEYMRFVEDKGYEKEEYWEAGGFGEYKEPEKWETQQEFLTRPVVGVSWFEAMAYIVWLGPGYSLPTEAQWERAARGPGEGYMKYPWEIRNRVRNR